MLRWQSTWLFAGRLAYSLVAEQLICQIEMYAVLCVKWQMRLLAWEMDNSFY